MAAPATIAVLLELAQRQVDAAATRLADVQRQRREAERQRDLLRQYQGEYFERQRDLTSLDVPTLANFTAFLGNLETAVAQQETNLHNLEARVSAALQHWEEARRHQRSVELLAERRAATVRQAEGRREAKQHDELAARVAGRARSAGH